MNDSQKIIELEKEIALLHKIAEAAKFYAFHHGSCPWIYGKDCQCGKENLDKALSHWRLAMVKQLMGEK